MSTKIKFDSSFPTINSVSIKPKPRVHISGFLITGDSNLCKASFVMGEMATNETDSANCVDCKDIYSQLLEEQEFQKLASVRYKQSYRGRLEAISNFGESEWGVLNYLVLGFGTFGLGLIVMGPAKLIACKLLKMHGWNK